MNTKPNYKKYNLSELYDIYHHINRDLYPDRFKIVSKEIELREIKGEVTSDNYNQFNYNKRSFLYILILSIITIGIYIFYWYFSNLKEIGFFIKFKENDKEYKLSLNLFYFYIFSIILSFIILFLIVLKTQVINIFLNPFFILFIIILNIFPLFFNYYYSMTIHKAQQILNLKTFNMSNVFLYYTINILLKLLGLFFIDILSYIAIIFEFIYIYKIQKEINIIWDNYKSNNI
jgi:hypothetical protein